MVTAIIAVSGWLLQGFHFISQDNISENKKKIAVKFCHFKMTICVKKKEGGLFISIMDDSLEC